LPPNLKLTVMFEVIASLPVHQYPCFTLTLTLMCESETDEYCVLV
jgi:hypothetical protein